MIQYVHHHYPQKNPSRSNLLRLWFYIYTHTHVMCAIEYIFILHVPADIEVE